MTERELMANEKWYAFRKLPAEEQIALTRSKRESGTTDVQIQKEYGIDKSTWQYWVKRHKMWVNGPPRPGVSKSARRSDTLCWVCAKYGGHCSWSSRLEPVEGWIVEEIDEPTWVSPIQKIVPSVTVIKCPEFVEDGK